MAGPEDSTVGTNTEHGVRVVPELPRLVAAFMVKFDVRKGYTLVWQQCKDGVDLDGTVEYKSLPSGLHNVEQDLVYFVQNEYAGVSAFINKPGLQSERNARMLAVGALVPLDQGRMGKSWRHAGILKQLAEKQSEDPDNFDALEAYWNEFKESEDNGPEASPPDSPNGLQISKSSQAQGSMNGYQSNRKISTATVVPPPGQTLSEHHPALSLPRLIRQFGPLIFPLYRAALLRKRILFVGEAPVELNCNCVYDLSILSALPRSLLNLLPIDGIPDLKLQPLFSVGVQDIPQLAASRQSTDSFLNLRQGWTACTTDDVLATKPELFDLLVNLPSESSQHAEKKAYPKIIRSSPDLSRSFPKTSIRSTQRDARRYLNLRAALRALEADCSQTPDESTVSDDSDAQSTTSVASSTLSRTSIVEPTSWPQMAYTSLVWWASAGEKRSGVSEEEDLENEQDAVLFRGELDEEGLTKEVAIVAYFQRLTNLIFTTLSDLISRTDGDGGEYKDDESDSEDDGAADESAVVESSTTAAIGGENAALLPDKGNEAHDEDVEITPEDMLMMGLDVWSSSDRTFVEDLVGLWWGRRVVIRGGTIECCGVRIL